MKETGTGGEEIELGRESAARPLLWRIRGPVGEGVWAAHASKFLVASGPALPAWTVGTSWGEASPPGHPPSIKEGAV